jgi:hypothetical protein
MSAFMLEMNRETAGSYLDTEEGTLIQWTLLRCEGKSFDTKAEHVVMVDSTSYGQTLLSPYDNICRYHHTHVLNLVHTETIKEEKGISLKGQTVLNWHCQVVYFLSIKCHFYYLINSAIEILCIWCSFKTAACFGCTHQPSYGRTLTHKPVNYTNDCLESLSRCNPFSIWRDMYTLQYKMSGTERQQCDSHYLLT